MNLHKQTIDDISLSGKRVIIRADFNVPLDDSLQITDDTRIRSTLPTINRVVDDGGKAIVCSHLGRPNRPEYRKPRRQNEAGRRHAPRKSSVSFRRRKK
jgi:3-phosphoglycerate kinase